MISDIISVTKFIYNSFRFNRFINIQFQIQIKESMNESLTYITSHNCLLNY
jgi:hypothetical protein